MSNELLEFMLIKKKDAQFTASAVENYNFRVPPRTGEFIELSNSDEEPEFYQVIAVVHDGDNPETQYIYVELVAKDGANFHQKLANGEL